MLFGIHIRIPWSPAGLALMVAASAVRSPTSTRAGAQDDVSFTNSLKLGFCLHHGHASWVWDLERESCITFMNAECPNLTQSTVPHSYKSTTPNVVALFIKVGVVSVVVCFMSVRLLFATVEHLHYSFGECVFARCNMHLKPDQRE